MRYGDGWKSLRYSLRPKGNLVLRQRTGRTESLQAAAQSGRISIFSMRSARVLKRAGHWTQGLIASGAKTLPGR